MLADTHIIHLARSAQERAVAESRPDLARASPIPTAPTQTARGHTPTPSARGLPPQSSSLKSLRRHRYNAARRLHGAPMAPRVESETHPAIPISFIFWRSTVSLASYSSFTAWPSF